MQIQNDVSTTMTATTATTTNSEMGIGIGTQTGQHAVESVATTPLPGSTGQSAAGEPKQDVQQSLKSMQKQLDLMNNTSFQLGYDKDIDRVIVKYVSKDTGEVVRQIPSKDFVSFEKEFVKTIGMLFDKKV